MAFISFRETSSEEIPTLWTCYRKLLMEFTKYLDVTGREKKFKLFCYGSIPTKNWDVGIEDWLTILEQSDVLSMHRLKVLDYFLKTFCDSHKMRSTIREFQYRLHLVQELLSPYYAESHGKLKLCLCHAKYYRK